jgi:hypothetical protein
MPKKQDAPKIAEPPTAQPQADDSKIVRANLARETYPADDFAVLYANDTQVQLSPWDFRLIFGLITDAPTPERLQVRIKLVGEVRMSPQHAKRVTKILTQQLKRYEDTFGAIPTPED